MEIRGQGRDRHGRTWTAVVLHEDEAAEVDFQFWYEQMTPAERVLAVEGCTLSALEAQGIDELPRLRRVSRIVPEA